jgi:predicted PurR-regulated permease PerM
VRKTYRDALILAILIAASLYLVWQLRHVLLLIYISILFAVIFMPAVRRTQKIGIRNWHPGRGTAFILLVFAAAIIISLLATFMLPPIVQDLREMGQDLPSAIQQLIRKAESLPVGKKIESSVTPEHITTGLREFVGKAVAAAQGVFSGLMNLLVVIVLAAYFIANGRETFRWTMSLVPARHRLRLHTTLLRAAERAQRWLTGQMLLMLILGSASTIVFGLLHIRYFYALGVFAGVANFIPVLGPVATVIVAGLVAALDSWTKALGVLIFYLIYQQVESAYLTPRIMRATVDLPGVAVVVALMIGGQLAGFAGALVAVPTAAILATVLNEYASDDAETPAVTDI